MAPKYDPEKIVSIWDVARLGASDATMRKIRDNWPNKSDDATLKELWDALGRGFPPLYDLFPCWRDKFKEWFGDPEEKRGWPDLKRDVINLDDFDDLRKRLCRSYAAIREMSDRRGRLVDHIIEEFKIRGLLVGRRPTICDALKAAAKRFMAEVDEMIIKEDEHDQEIESD